MGFIFFLLATATLLIRPAEQFPELRGLRLYETLILLCFAFSLNSVLDQFSLKTLETRPITVCILGLLIAVVLSQLSQGNATAAGDTGFEFFKLLVYYILLVGNLTTVSRLRTFLVCLGLFAVLCVSLAVLQYHDVIILHVPDQVLDVREKNSEDTASAFVNDTEYDPVSGQMVEFKRLRGTGTFRDPNDLSLLLVTGLFIALYGLTDGRQGVFRLAWLVPLVFFVYALSLTQSRGGFFGMLMGFMALFYARFGWRGTLFLGMPFLPVALVVFGGRMANLSTSEGTGQTRIQIWSDAIVAMTSAPLFGIGMGELGTVVGKAAHNSFLSAFAELGFFGGSLFFGTFFFALVMLLRLLKIRQSIPDPELRRLLPFLAALLAAYGFGIMSLSRVEAVPTYLLLGLVTVTANLAANYAPSTVMRFDSQLAQRLVLASIGYLAVAYMFVRVFKV